MIFPDAAIRHFRSRERIEDSRVVYLSTRRERQEKLADEWRQEKGYVPGSRMFNSIYGVLGRFALGVAGYNWLRAHEAPDEGEPNVER